MQEVSVVVLDLDNCVFNDSHRKHLSDNAQFDEYHSQHVYDQVNPWAKRLVENLMKDGSIIIVFNTGRCASKKTSTMAQLRQTWPGIQFSLYMRPIGCRDRTELVKARHLRQSLEYVRNELQLVPKRVWAVDDIEVNLSAYLKWRARATCLAGADLAMLKVNVMNEHGLHGAVPEFVANHVSKAFSEGCWIEFDNIKGLDHNKGLPAGAVCEYAETDWSSVRRDVEDQKILGQLIPSKPSTNGPSCAAADLLLQMSETFRERNAQYKDNSVLVGKVMAVLFPEGVQLSKPKDFEIWHLFELLIVKLTRFVNSGLKHPDSIHDLAVYAAMIELLVDQHDIANRD